MSTPTNKYNHYIVAIGASAGGLEAIHEFFDSMPDTPHISFIIIQHLSPDYKSLLVELVARHTDMKVYEATYDLTIERKCIYVIPNTKLITVQKGQLKLSDKKNGKMPNNAIDVFLYSLANDKKDKAICVILSGTGTDGTKGSEAIKKDVREISARWKIYQKTGDSKPSWSHQPGMAESYTARSEKAAARITRHGETRSQSALWEDFKDTLTEDLHYVVLMDWK